MRYCGYDLNQQEEDHWAILGIRGSSANVIPLDHPQLRPRPKRPIPLLIGGYRSRVRPQIPRGDHRPPVINGGEDRSRIELEVLTAEGLRTALEDETTLVGSKA